MDLFHYFVLGGMLVAAVMYCCLKWRRSIVPTRPARKLPPLPSLEAGPESPEEADVSRVDRDAVSVDEVVAALEEEEDALGSADPSVPDPSVVDFLRSRSGGRGDE